jgi:uncharacterized protein (TIGR02466 family)
MRPRFIEVNQTILAYPTPIRRHLHAGVQEFNRELAARILELREHAPGKRLSNVGGWHSDDQLLQTLGEPYAGRLARMFMDDVREAFAAVTEAEEPLPATVSIEAWANVNTRGDTNVPHIHGGCPWSGVYYVACDTGPAAGGGLVFADPRTAALMVVHPYNPFKGANHITLTPEPGVMVVFPSFLYHGVQPYLGDSPRISIAFNLLAR